ncbi:YbdD/YjiX family protein [Variovorax sp. HJSM1_2]|uniref:YbdD/YjiX family protein n=1 Tax=Variovorax sp. HJSM1_2 TaxID=3366263 RepID=UPI003BD8EA75
MLEQLTTMGRYLGQTALLMVGMPNYDSYAAHQRSQHPDAPVMSYEEFFRERQEARYGGGGKGGRVGRCC